MKVINGVLTRVEDGDIVNGTFIIPEGIEIIGASSFSGCESLENIIIPSSIKQIGAFAFSGCESLENIVIPSSIKKIGEYAFKNCKNLVSIVIPSSVKEIGYGAFNYCESLKTITIQEGVEIIGEHAFDGCKSLENIVIPGSVKRICGYSFRNCVSLKTITIEEGVEIIDERVFDGCISLENIVIPSSVKVIGEASFEICKLLKTITIKEGVEIISGNAFKRCISLESIVIPSSVKEIGKCSFRNCKSLKTITIKEGLEIIDSYAFLNCSSLENIVIPSSVKQICKNDFIDCYNLNKLTTPYGTYNFGPGNLHKIYLYLYANYLLREKYNSLDEFIENPYIRQTMESDIIHGKNGITKFKNLYFKLRKTYDVSPELFGFIDVKQTEKFNLSVWNNIKNTFEYKDDLDMSKAFAEMIGVFGLFENDKYRNNRVQYFKNLFKKRKIVISKRDYDNLYNNLKDRFIMKENLYFNIKDGIEIPLEFQIYLKDKLTEKEVKKIKKLTGTFGKRLNDFVKENYEPIYLKEYKLKEEYIDDKFVRNQLFNQDILGTVNRQSLHRMFDGCIQEYNEEFFKFFQDNLETILNDEVIQSNINNIQKNFDKIRKHYLIHSGVENVSLKQAMDYLNENNFEYNEGNYDLNLAVKKAGVVDQEAFNYFQTVYEKNDIRKLYSLVRRSNIFEINGYTIKAELLRRDDESGMLTGEPNNTNCCQTFGGVGHNCMAHSVNSDDGGVFETRLLKDGDWILLTESWDWQNNNVYCHDNIEATRYFKDSDESLKEAVAIAYRLDAEHIIEKSKKEVEEYIKSRKKIIDKSISSDKEQELKCLSDLEQREVIKVVTTGEGNDSLGLANYFSSKIKVNQDMFVNGQTYTLSNFQPVNYNKNQPYFNPNKTAYSDAKETQYIMAGSIEDLVVSKLEPLVPIYRDERRIVYEDKENLRDYTINKMKKIEKIGYPENMQNLQDTFRNDWDDSKIILGEDWYLIYEEKANNEIYIADLVKVNPSIDDEHTIQNQEMMREIYKLVDKYDKVSGDLKEDTSYLLYLINKKMGYFEQIGEDIAYSFKDSSNKKIITEEEQENILKRAREIKNNKNPDQIMHKIIFKKGPKFIYNSLDEENTRKR